LGSGKLKPIKHYGMKHEKNLMEIKKEKIKEESKTDIWKITNEMEITSKRGKRT
jgi:hypothetical protein